MSVEYDSYNAGFEDGYKEAETRIEALEAKLYKAIWELERLGFDFESTLGRELMGVYEEDDEDE